jgi:predicted Zn-dependent peptidase
MIQFERFTLPNGLRVIVHRDTSTPMAVVNVMYNVGAGMKTRIKQALPFVRTPDVWGIVAH